MGIQFINLFSSKEAAFYVEESPIVEKNTSTYKGVQLLPGHPYEYVQITDNPQGVVLEDWTVKVMTLCGSELADISEKFLVKAPFDDNNGTPQIVWSLKQVGQDFGSRLIYLEITQTEGETFYTNPFVISDDEGHKITRFDYKEDTDLAMQSTGLVTYFRNWRNADTVNQRYEKSTSMVRTLSVEQRKIARMFTEIWNNDLMLRFSRMLQCRYLYRDLTRHYLYEAFEIPDPEGTANFKDAEYLLTPYYGENYDPDYAPPLPQPPAPGGDLVMKVVGRKRTSPSLSYALTVIVPIIDNFDTVLFNFSYAKINGVVVQMSPFFFVVDNGNMTFFSNGTPAETTPGQIHLSEVVIRVSDNGTPPTMWDYIKQPGTDVFTAAEITAQVQKEIDATITAI